ncbi:RidA family protein [Fodinicola acaciae]|uniref:RidA family protein n=1 Tax=Fodinicola acaciae TaxID=2681555 RepID=UPI0013D29F46|nr:RidA family protein [Fodinicola acaciae]
MIRQLDPAGLPAATGNYTHGTEVTGATRTVFVSGQVPWADEDGKLPDDFESQCRITWDNIRKVLTEAGMDLENLVKITTFLSDRGHREANSRIREEVLGAHRPAVTIIICDIYSDAWLLEIDAIAMA